MNNEEFDNKINELYENIDIYKIFTETFISFGNLISHSQKTQFRDFISYVILDTDFFDLITTDNTFGCDELEILEGKLRAILRKNTPNYISTYIIDKINIGGLIATFISDLIKSPFADLVNEQIFRIVMNTEIFPIDLAKEIMKFL